MKDVRLTQTATGGLDILMVDGRAAWATDGTEVAQHAAIRLNKYHGESVTGNSQEQGTKYYEIIFPANISRYEKELHLKKRILETTGAKRIIEFNWVQDGHEVTATGKIQTDWGEESISVGTVQL